MFIKLKLATPGSVCVNVDQISHVTVAGENKKVSVWLKTGEYYDLCMTYDNVVKLIMEAE